MGASSRTLLSDKVSVVFQEITVLSDCAAALEHCLSQECVTGYWTKSTGLMRRESDYFLALKADRDVLATVTVAGKVLFEVELQRGLSSAILVPHIAHWYNDVRVTEGVQVLCCHLPVGLRTGFLTVRKQAVRAEVEAALTALTAVCLDAA